jgi:branched-subunit amino acid aminotransferase/4-amino-4-deoxychorismate lyase
MHSPCTLPPYTTCDAQPIFVDGEGFVQEGPTSNLAIVTQDDQLLTPPPEDVCLAGVTIKRLLELVPEVGTS